MQSKDLAYQELADAVVLQAVNDYRNALDGKSYTKRLTAKEVVAEVEKFFRSDYLSVFTKLNGEYLIEQLRREHKEKQTKGAIMNVTLIQSTPNPIETIAKIASICYDSDPKDPMKLVEHLYENGHHSVFEHVYFTFKIEGISRACSHQLVRHRHCSFTQRSQRYCSEEGFDYIIPPTVDREPFEQDMNYIELAYKACQEWNNVPNEDARYILPNACATELYLSCNLRELIHIANERLCTRAQWEIRELVKQMVALVDPELQFMLVPKCKSATIICHSPCRK